VQSLRSWSSLSYKRYGTTLKPANDCKHEKICPRTSACACAGRNVSLFRHCNKHYSLYQKIFTQCAYRACHGEDLSHLTSPRYFLRSLYQWGEFCWFFSNIFLTVLTMNSQENTVNHQNTHSTEGTSHLGGKSSKFATWNSDIWCHVKTCFVYRSSRVDAIDGNKPTETSVVVKNDTASISSWCPLCKNNENFLLLEEQLF